MNILGTTSNLEKNIHETLSLRKEYNKSISDNDAKINEISKDTAEKKDQKYVKKTIKKYVYGLRL